MAIFLLAYPPKKAAKTTRFESLRGVVKIWKNAGLGLLEGLAIVRVLMCILHFQGQSVNLAGSVIYIYKKIFLSTNCQIF